METPRFEFIRELFQDEPELEARAQEWFFDYLRLVERIATRICGEERRGDDESI